MNKQIIFKFTFVFFFILNIEAQNTTFNNVAIGTDDPAYGVKIKSNFPGYTGGWARGFFVSNETGGQNLLSVFAQGQSVNGVSSLISSSIGKDFDNPYITFLPNGNVGIGTKEPSTNLDVFSSTSKSTLRIGSYAIGTKNDTGIDMYVDNAGNRPVYTRIGLGVLTASLGQETGYMPFSTIISGVLTEKMRIHSNGNVGIGTTNPSAKFESVGNEVNSFEAAGFYNTRVYGNVNDKSETRINLGKIEGDIREPMGSIGAFPDNNTDSSRGSLAFYTRESQAVKECVRILSNGNFGIGTIKPTEKLDVMGNAKISSYSPTLILQRDTDSGGYTEGIQTKLKDGTNNWYFGNLQSASWIVSKGDFQNPKMTILDNGKVGIGTSSPDEKLTVNGNIHAKEVKIDLSIPAPDYVFASDYKLKSLQEVEEYIKQNSHLPEIPSAKEIEKNGLLLAEMNMSLLKKVEELTLYMIEQNKRIEKLELENKTLKINK